MKKFLNKFLFFIVMLAVTIFILNINVTTRKGVDYQVYTIRLPLYLKLLDFFDRHYNYKHLAKFITQGAKTDQERLMKIFEWTYNNIRKPPPGLATIDDHAWYIIVRGYGESDQFSDVFTTLCNYTGLEAFFTNICSPSQTKCATFSFVALGKKWFVFDPYKGAYFKTYDGDLADIETIKNNDWVLGSLNEEIARNIKIEYYRDYIDGFFSLKKKGFNRANIQSPLNRFLYEINKIIKNY
ncbi:MAG: transglutaminase domain-containing protein [Candidatus Omnitrophica bacterium]|nr:transglutaminase domain-containing protein [Candidatus Omnitrophota bacterium]